MAKIAFSKLGLKVNENSVAIYPVEGNSNLTIEVKRYLPMQEKIEIVDNVLNQSVNQDKGFYNPIQMDMYLKLEIIYHYTNLSFTDKQKEDLFKLYDLLASNGVIENVLGLVRDEYNYLRVSVMESAQAITSFRNSAVGVLEAISQDYSNLDLDAEKIREELGDENNIALLRDVVSKLG